MKWNEQWVERFALLFIVLGFLMSILLRNSVFILVTVTIAGFICGRIFYLKRFKEHIFPFIIIISFFLIGYVAGSFSANRILVIILFILGFGISYYLHLKNILAIFKSESFIK
jgi:hypothetical protein